MLYSIVPEKLPGQKDAKKKNEKKMKMRLRIKLKTTKVKMKKIKIMIFGIFGIYLKQLTLT